MKLSIQITIFPKQFAQHLPNVQDHGRSIIEMKKSFRYLVVVKIIIGFWRKDEKVKVEMNQRPRELFSPLKPLQRKD